MMSEEKFILDLYKQIGSTNKKESLYLLYSIIQIKNANPTLQNIKNSLYVDIKIFVRLYIDSIIDMDYGYDQLNLKKITKPIENIGDLNLAVKICNYVKVILKKNHLEEEEKSFKKFHLKIQFRQILNDKKYILIKPFRLLYLLSAHNIVSIIITLILLLLATIVIFYQAPSENMQLYQITYDHYSNNYLINHTLNIISYILGFAEDFKITSLDYRGILLMAILKIFYISFVVNYIYKRVNELIEL